MVLINASALESKPSQRQNRRNIELDKPAIALYAIDQNIINCIGIEAIELHDIAQTVALEAADQGVSGVAPLGSIGAERGGRLKNHDRKTAIAKRLIEGNVDLEGIAIELHGQKRRIFQIEV